MQENAKTELNHILTPLFKRYVIQLTARVGIFAIAIALFVVDPSQLDFTTRFGIADGFDFVDFSCVLIALNLLSKLRPHAKIAMT